MGRIELNLETQKYKDIELSQCDRNYGVKNARRFYLFETNQAIWIPCAYLFLDGTIKPKSNLDWIFNKKNNAHILDLARKERKRLDEKYGNNKG